MTNGRRRKIRFIRALLLLVVAVCLFQMLRVRRLSAEYEKQQEELRELKEAYAEETVPAEEPVYAGETVYAEEIVSAGEPLCAKKIFDWHTWKEGTLSAASVILEQYAALYEENNDLAGWLTIEGMGIDYPVMQCEDDEYYLHHDYYGNDSKYGCLYVRGTADIHTPDTNFVIYGHNMKDGSMFGDLDLYKDEDFYREHSVISFDTLYEERSYEIVAVFLSQVYDPEEDAFKYYQFYHADTREEFERFYNNIKEASLYDTGVTAQFGDTFLTLSTCAYHVRDGRLVVVAKKRNE